MARPAQEKLWLCKLSIRNLYSAGKPTMFIDSQSAVAFASRAAKSNKSKHIDLRHHFVQDLIKMKPTKLKAAFQIDGGNGCRYHDPGTWFNQVCRISLMWDGHLTFVSLCEP
eukprot:Plantae.Rhodophyta-Palmaria_palmata.ctg22272.p1 GENE.Plantae.Rhodophyta-Palmaria_palmata.ctg22272~~Plantae.Rhodophyta-Palmaria_palmata.ctg22272.p1  ORF type:complete len:112 (-),score=3.90 Plantae.Rhodophyta-Palmaria_palmata.ctg22272:379-714(-)